MCRKTSRLRRNRCRGQKPTKDETTETKHTDRQAEREREVPHRYLAPRSASKKACGTATPVRERERCEGGERGRGGVLSHVHTPTRRQRDSPISPITPQPRKGVRGRTVKQLAAEPAFPSQLWKDIRREREIGRERERRQFADSSRWRCGGGGVCGKSK